MSKESWLYGAAVLAGIGAWILVTAISGQREAWDSQWYLLLGLPLICAVSASLAYVEPTRPWRWGLVPLLAQTAWMFGTQGVGDLWPLGIVASLVLAIPPILTAYLGALLPKRSGR